MLFRSLCLVFTCVFARIPFLEKVFTPQEVKEGNNNYYLGEVTNSTFYPFQRTIIINNTLPDYYLKVTHNESFLVINSQFLTTEIDGEMTPLFSTPLNSSILTVRLQTRPCYPYQGGPYYRNNETIPYGDTNNELVQTRVTSEDGFLNMTVSRPWAARVSDEQSVVISESSQGIILCTNVKWREVDGAFSSVVSMTALFTVVGLIVRQLFFE